VTAGIGINYLDFNLDYAYVPYGFLGATHRITLTYALAKRLPQPIKADPTPVATPTPVKESPAKTLKKRMETIEAKINTGVLKIIQFKSGSAELLSNSRATLDMIAEEFKKFPDLKILIEGHTDSEGLSNDNQVLSQLRVERVKNYLVQEHGLNPNNFEAIGYGETRPLADNTTEAGRQKNRRVEFTILSDQ
jgi:OOP family OmpA-OmpF porin